MSWCRDDSCLSLLDERAGPFSTPAFRATVVATTGGWRDASVGASFDDGTRAAVPILVRGREADSLPPSGYGGIVASRPLTAAEESSLLDMTFEEVGVRQLEVRMLDALDRGGAGEPVASASIVSTETEPASAFARLARRSLAKATRAGCTVEAGASFDAFWPVYAAASSAWAMRYPEQLVRLLVREETARVHAVRLRGDVVAALLTVVRGTHWMCWLAGQAPAGREVAASYLAYDAVLAEAYGASVPFVNLGASAGGGAEFKQHLGAVSRPIRRWRRRSRRIPGFLR